MVQDTPVSFLERGFRRACCLSARGNPRLLQLLRPRHRLRVLVVGRQIARRPVCPKAEKIGDAVVETRQEYDGESDLVDPPVAWQ